MNPEEKQDPFPRRVREDAAGSDPSNAAFDSITHRFPVCLEAAAGTLTE